MKKMEVQVVPEAGGGGGGRLQDCRIALMDGYRYLLQLTVPPEPDLHRRALSESRVSERQAQFPSKQAAIHEGQARC